MKILGMRIEQYVDMVDFDNNELEPIDLERYIMYGRHKDKFYEIELYSTHGMCYSGWTTASWGHSEIKEVEKVGRITHRPKEEIIIDNLYEQLQGEHEIHNDLFTVEYDGGDSYYPGGYVSVNLEYFDVDIRHKNKRPVWIFHGNSGLGKSYLAELIKEKTIYETDSSSMLPESITADIVVLGNKYLFTLQDVIKNLFGEVEPIPVAFNGDYAEKKIAETTEVTVKKEKGYVLWFNQDFGVGRIEDFTTGVQLMITAANINTVDRSLDAGDKISFIVDDTFTVKNITYIG